jgi:hypothetical protein
MSTAHPPTHREHCGHIRRHVAQGCRLHIREPSVRSACCRRRATYARERRKSTRHLPHRLLTHGASDSHRFGLTCRRRCILPSAHLTTASRTAYPSRFSNPMCHTPFASQVRMSVASTLSGSAPPSGRLYLLLLRSACGSHEWAPHGGGSSGLLTLNRGVGEPHVPP